MLYLYAVILLLNIVTGIFSLIFSETWGEFIVYTLLLSFFAGVLLILNREKKFMNDIK